MFRKRNHLKILCGVFASIVLTIPSLAQSNRPSPESTDTSVIAVVLGKNITAKEKENLNGLIFGALLDKFSKEQDIAPNDDELDTFVIKTEEIEKQENVRLERDRERLRKELKSSSMSDQERKEKKSWLQNIESILKTKTEIKAQAGVSEEQKREMNLQIARQFVKSWKINKSLFEKYGGRVIFQQAGVEPLDAYRQFLKEQEKNGAFRIIDKKYEAGFWRYFINDSMHTFYQGDDGAKFLKTPWWMMEKPSEE
jgi:hypothetical protein